MRWVPLFSFAIVGRLVACVRKQFLDKIEKFADQFVYGRNLENVVKCLVKRVDCGSDYQHIRPIEPLYDKQVDYGRRHRKTDGDRQIYVVPLAFFDLLKQVAIFEDPQNCDTCDSDQGDRQPVLLKE